MAKTSKKQMDRDAKRVMAELEKNSKESLDALAKRLKFSRQKIWRIIKGLDKSRAIWGHTAIVDDERRELKSYVLMLKRSTKPMEEKALDSLTSPKLQDGLDAPIESILYVHGEYDWILTFTAPGIMEAKKLCDAFLAAHPGFFGKTSLMETLVAVRKHHIANPNASRLKEFLV